MCNFNSTRAKPSPACLRRLPRWSGNTSSPQDVHRLDLLLPRLPRGLPVLPLAAHIPQPGDGLLGEAEADADVVEALDLHVDDLLHGDRTILQERATEWKRDKEERTALT